MTINYFQASRLETENNGQQKDGRPNTRQAYPLDSA